MFEEYCTTLLQLAASSGQGPVLDNVDNIILTVRSIHSLMLKNILCFLSFEVKLTL